MKVILNIDYLDLNIVERFINRVDKDKSTRIIVVSRSQYAIDDEYFVQVTDKDGNESKVSCVFDYFLGGNNTEICEKLWHSNNDYDALKKQLSVNDTLVKVTEAFYQEHNIDQFEKDINGHYKHPIILEIPDDIDWEFIIFDYARLTEVGIREKSRYWMPQKDVSY